MQNRYLDFLIDSNLQGVNGLFVLLFKYENGGQINKQYYLPTVEIKDYVMINEKNVFWSNYKKWFQNILVTLKKLQQVKVMITQLDVY